MSWPGRDGFAGMSRWRHYASLLCGVLFLKYVFVSEHAVQGFGNVRQDGPRPI